MKVILLNTSERIGGAAIVANRLMKALISNGFEVNTLVLNKQTDDEKVISIQSSFVKRQLAKIFFIWERFIIFIHNGFCKENLFAVSIANTGSDISKHPLIREADIIHVHWINQGFLSIKGIGKLIKTGKPIVWTMHDMWPCTGICHHSRACDNFKKECGQCFFLKSKKNKDLSHKIFLKKKQAIFSNNNLTLVGCSTWLANKAKVSGLSKRQNIWSIPNPIDIDVFKVLDSFSSRKKLGLPENKKLLLFGAANVTDRRKGIYYLMDALNELTNWDDLCLVVFGQMKAEFKEVIKIPVYQMGYISEQELIVTIYNAVDLFVTPSLEENLPNTIMEAMACGTPCVGFNIGGIPEMIDHKQNGYVAEYKNSKDLAEGINWILNIADYKHLSLNAREKAVKNYSQETVAKQYINLYKRHYHTTNV